jgi:hypothetical protein
MNRRPISQSAFSRPSFWDLSAAEKIKLSVAVLANILQSREMGKDARNIVLDFCPTEGTWIGERERLQPIVKGDGRQEEKRKSYRNPIATSARSAVLLVGYCD